MWSEERWVSDGASRCLKGGQWMVQLSRTFEQSDAEHGLLTRVEEMQVQRKH